VTPAAHPEDPPLAPGLYLVATPLGNLEDITLRALRILRSAAQIACEDTRHSQKLFQHFGISAPCISLHAHNEKERAEPLLDAMRSGAAIAVISDAGTPGISDPGGYLVAATIAAGLPVFPVPGPSAAIAALVASGLDTSQFFFAGFPPHRAGERRTFFEGLAEFPATLVFYETPHRIQESLADACAAFGPDRTAVLARELTKLHEEFLRGTLRDLQTAINARDIIRGEMVLLVAACPPNAPTQDSAPSLRDQMQALLTEGLGEQEALKRLARQTGRGKSELYREWQRRKGLKKYAM
jgi:16S rRNA (cytidine1402-2'-O)-methyltransferase